MHLDFFALLWLKASVDMCVIGKRTSAVTTLVVYALHRIYFLTHVVLVTYFIVVLLTVFFRR